MKQLGERDERLHQRVWELLPWYVNGTLETGEVRSVEDHTAHCERCRDELESCRRIGEAMSPAAQAMPSPHPAQLARLMSRLDEAESSALGPRLKNVLAVTPKAVRWTLAVQLAAVLLLAAGATGLFWSQRAAVPPLGPPAAPASPAEYRTLSEPAVPAAAVFRVRVVFAEEATERQIREVLLGAGGQIAGGPSPLGAYEVELPAGRDPLPVVLSYLRARREVRFAEPIAGDER
ncbi:MAG TPA: zf-HC2 domain-containing protein [Thermoanaerobaculia bacterium]|nr:zf-HC2 domain-containing protein [Thermoanaerobaculia bacterium]